MVATKTGLYAQDYKTIDGLQIRFATNGKTGGDPILMLSPLPESILAYLPIWDAISELGPVIAVDLPPFGRSQVNKEARTPEEVGEFVIRILDVFGLKKPHVIAPDIGTSACLFAAANHPGIFKSLITGGGATDHKDILGSLDEMVNAPSLEPFKGLTGEEFVRSATADMKKYKLPEDVLQDYIASYTGDKFWDAMAFIRDYPNALPRLAGRLHEITVPCQLTVGKHGPFVPVSNAEKLLRGLPKAKLDVVDCGHFVWEDEPQKYAQIAREFIQGGYAKL